MDEGWLVIGSGVVGAGGAIAAAIVANRAAARRRREDRYYQDKQRLEEACADFIKAFDSYVAAIHAMPFRRRVATGLDQLAERYLGDVLELFALLLQRLLFGYRWERLLDDIVASSARLRVVAPPDIRGVMDEIHTLLTRGPDLKTEEGARRWRDLRDDLAAHVQPMRG